MGEKFANSLRCVSIYLHKFHIIKDCPVVNQLMGNSIFVLGEAYARFSTVLPPLLINIFNQF